LLENFNVGVKREKHGLDDGGISRSERTSPDETNTSSVQLVRFVTTGKLVLERDFRV
jgi:hypothetical protein